MKPSVRLSWPSSSFRSRSLPAARRRPDVGSVSFASTRLSAQELARTKAELRRITTSNMTRTDNLDEVRAQVEPLVAKLAAHFGDRPLG
ncbi:MAG: hypothetical protein U0169_26945 [Polyangiaceae bacterium]